MAFTSPSSYKRGRPSAVIVHLGKKSVTIRPAIGGWHLGRLPHGTFVGAVGMGLLAVSWLRRSDGSKRHWGIDRQTQLMPDDD